MHHTWSGTEPTGSEAHECQITFNANLVDRRLRRLRYIAIGKYVHKKKPGLW